MEQTAWDPEEFRGHKDDSDGDDDFDEGSDDDEPEYGSCGSEGGHSAATIYLSHFDDVCLIRPYLQPELIFLGTRINYHIQLVSQ